MMPSRQRRLFSLLLAAAFVAACSTNAPVNNATGTAGDLSAGVAKTAANVIGGPLIPDANVMLGPSVSYPLEKIVYWGAWAAAAWLILDPLAPNWEIQEARFPQDHVHLQLSMKRYYSGGAGEARAVFHRRAKEMMRAGNFAGYEVVEYSEGMDSSVLGSQRKAAGVIRLTKASG
jgi:hypothetical protein